MELSLQFGYGMMEHCRSLLDRWHGGLAILSPRDLTDDQLERMSTSIGNIAGASLLLDPQFYLPHADHERLRSHDFWPSSYQSGLFWQGPQLVDLLDKLASLNERLNAAAFVLPGMFAIQVDEDWLATQEAVMSEALARNYGLPLCASIALSSEAVRDANQVGLLLERAEMWHINNYYVVCEHPAGQYLVDDPNWLVNVLDIVAGLRLLGCRVLLGYCNHQMLIASIANVNAIASGTWMNVRSFPPEKFRAAYDEEMKQRATWYYCPQALSEYKIPFLDIASRLGLLSEMAPPPHFGSEYVDVLFSGAQPSTVGFTEQSAFRHYLHCLHMQVAEESQASFDEAVASQVTLLDTAERCLSRLVSRGIRGGVRDFSAIVDVNRAALAAFESIRGAMIRRRWSQLPTGINFE